MNNQELILDRISLFDGITNIERTSLLNCLQANTKTFVKNQIVLQAQETISYVGIVISGTIQIIKEDLFGNRTIITNITEGNLFGEAFACSKTKTLPVSVLAVTNSVILMFDYKRVLTSCPSSCSFHSKLIENMLRILAEKNILLNQKIEYLSKRTTRDKLITYFSAQATEQKSNTFTIPFNRQELADYLCVERSAMSAELSRMKKEGYLTYQKSTFTLDCNQ